MSRARLVQLQSLYTENSAARTAIRDRVAAENRAALTPEEETQVRAFTEALDRIVPELEALASSETRSQHVADLLAGALPADQGGNGDQQNRTAAPDNGTLPAEVRGDGTGNNRTSRYTTQDRDPGHYRSAREGGRHSFFHDLVYSRPEFDGLDPDARTRMGEHQRALTTGVAGAGLVPPKWLTDEYAPLARQGRMVANTVRHIDLGDDPRPMTLPHQTTGTDAIIAEQSSENTHPTETDAFATSTTTVTPKPTSGIQIVSRQMVDMTDPAVDELIYGDMIDVYDTKVEAAVCAALVTAAGSATVTFANEAAFSDVDPTPVAIDAVIDTEFAVWGARKRPPDWIAMRIGRWGKYRKLRDLDGRSLIPPEMARQQMVNVDGGGTLAARGQIEDVFVMPTDGLGTTAYPETAGLVYRAQDTILFEGALQRFRFEEVAGPESIKLGIWAYTAVTVRYTSSVERIVVTAAT